MADEIGRAVIEVDADMARFEAAMAKATTVAEGFERSGVDSAGKAAAAFARVGDGAGAGLEGLDAKTKRVVTNLQREIAKLKLTDVGGAFEIFNADLKGANLDKIRPFVEMLEQTREAARSLTREANLVSFDKLLAESAKVGAVEKNITQLEAALVGLGAEEREVAETNLFNARASESKKLFAATTAMREYAKVWDEVDAAEKKAAGNKAFIDGLQRQAAAIGKTRVDLLELEAAERGLSAELAPTIAKLRAQEVALYGVGHASRDARVSANQLRAAYATLPAQITDVFTSLAGGQNPLLVLIQQGGQIKDSFGGVGNTFKELLKFLTPARLALGGIGAVLAAVALGYKQGADESSEYVRSIVLTGNAAGVTVGQLQAMARAISASGGTQGKAAEVLARFAASAKVGAAELQKVAQAAIGLERVGGPAVEETAKAFESLAKDPAKAAATLNEQTNFLTASIFKQIQSLEEQGRVSEAAALAQSRFADVLESRKAELQANLGSIERGWIAIKDAIKGAVDALASIGRASTTEKQIEVGKAALERLPSGNKDPLGIYTKQRQAIEAQLELLNKTAFREAERGDLARIKNDAERAGITLLQKQDSLLDKEAKKNKEIAEIRTLAAKSRLGNGPGFSGKEEAALIDAVNEKYKEKQKKGEDLAKTYGSLIAASLENERAMQAEGAGMEKLTQGEKRLLDLQAKIESGTVTYNQALYAQAAAQFVIESAIEKSRRAETERQKAMEKAAEHSKKLIEQEEKYNDSLEKSAVSLLAQVQRLEIGEEAFIARENAQQRDEAAGLTWQAQMEGGNAILEERARLLLLTADLTERQQAGKIDKMLRDQAQALADSNRELALEASLIGRSSDERALALAQLRIQLKLERDILAIRASTPVGPKQDSQIADTIAQADDALKGLVDKKNIDLLNDLLDPSRVSAFGQAFTDAFDGANESIQRAGASLSDLAGIFKSYAAEQEKLSRGIKANREDTKSSPEEKLRRENALIQQQGELQISTYASMAGAAKGFFEEGTKGYKALQAAETVFRAYQLASDLVKGVSAAAVAIANQAQGEPYSAFARMAVMTAAMASLGFATGFLGKSGGGTQAGAAQRQGGAATGRIVTPDQANREKAAFRGGSVFGDDEARSESIENSIDALEKHARLELDYSRSQLSALEAIRDAMAGVANLIVRSVGGGLTSGKNLGIPTGTLSKNKGDPFNDATGGLTIANAVNTVFTNDPLLGGIVKTLQGFWGKVKQKITDSGLEVSGTIADLMVRQFADVETTSTSWFGLKKKVTDSTVFGQEKDAQDIAAQFGLIFKAIGDTVAASAEVLGREGGDALAAAIASFPVAIDRLSLKDLKGDELQEAISAAIGAQADTIAKALLPGLDEFQTVGQGYFETLIRVSSGIEVANYQLELLGITAIDYTNIIRKQGDVSAEIVRQSIVAAETAGGVLSNVGQIVNTLSGDSEDLAETYTQLLDVRGALVKIGESGESLTTAMIRGAGGLDNLADSLDTFFSEFFSKDEQLSANAGALASEFAKLGVTMPGTRDEFRALVDVLGNDASEAGQKLFAKVVGLAGAFDEVADAAEEAASRLTDSISDAISRFGTPQERQGSTFGSISTSLKRDAGVSVSIGQLMGASITDIEAFARSFIAVTANSDAAKTAVLDAANALFDLKTEASSQRGTLEVQLLRAQGREMEAVARERQNELAQLAALETSLGVAAGTFAGLQTQIYAVTDAAALLANQQRVQDQSATLQIALLQAQGQAYSALAIERGQEIASLSRLEATLGITAGTFTKLQEEIYAAADAAKVLSGLDNVIADFLKPKDLAFFRATKIQNTLAGGGITGITVEQIMGATSADIIELWQSVGTAGKQAILDSYGLLNQLQTDLTKDQRKGLEDQIAGMKGLRDLAKDIKKFVSELKFGDLSPLSAEAQLAEAQSLFETTLSKALGGDTKAQGDLQGVAQALLTEAQEAFASGPGFTKIFDRVVGSLEALGLAGEALDPQITLLESIFDNDRRMLDALLSIDGTLKGVPTALSGGIGDRDFVTGPKGSSGGLSGPIGTAQTRSETAVIDFTPILVGQQSDAAASQKKIELMQKQLDRMSESLAEQKTQTATLNAIATIGQATAVRTSEKLDALKEPLAVSATVARREANRPRPR